MKRWAFCKPGGEIHSECGGLHEPEPMAGMTLHEIPEDVSFRTHYRTSSGFVAYTPEQLAARAAKPHMLAQWDCAAGAWVDARSLQEFKDVRWASVKAQRDQAEAGGFTWDGSVFDSDQMSQGKIQGAAQLATLAALAGEASEDFVIEWTLADNTVRALNGTDIINVGRALGNHLVTVHATGRALREAIETATSIAEVNAISWPV